MAVSDHINALGEKLYMNLNTTEIEVNFNKFLNSTILSWSTFSTILMGVDVPIGDFTPKKGMFYVGSRMLMPLAEATGLPIDQINFLIGSVYCIVMGFVMRFVFKPPRFGPQIRAGIEAVLGAIVLYFCFGNQIRVLLLQAAVSYMLLICIPCKRFAAILVNVWCMAYLTAVHLCRLHYDYGGYTIDISGPIMITTQRLSSLSFNLLDGERLKNLMERRKADGLRVEESDDEGQPPHFGYSKVIHNDLDEQPNAESSEDKNAVQLRSFRIDEIEVDTIDEVNSPSRHRNHNSLVDSTSFRSRECLISEDAPGSYSGHGHSRHSTGSSNTAVPMRNTLKNSLRASFQALNTNFKPIVQETFQETPFENLPPRHAEHAVDRRPNLIEFAAYVMYFHGALVGPFVFYKYYRDYLSGYKERRMPGFPVTWLIRCLVRIFITILLTAQIAPSMPFELVNSFEFTQMNFGRKLLYSWVSLFLIRQKYYFAWSLAELMCTCAGLGYTGTNPTTKEPEYNHVVNFNYLGVECALSLKQVVDSWNISTTHWLREVFYDRAPGWCKTLAVFMISAFWHGFYPGYYLMFATFAMFTFTSRLWHKEMRPYFRKNAVIAKFYDVFTIVVTHFSMEYAQIAFHLMTFWASIKYWLIFYYVPHIISAVILLCGFIKGATRVCCRRRH
ncbi:Lysophospholipid acyltransferase 1 [Cichlidogyrus casuarinus]|uniref:Lysophospholipid acyltransferase 1 n=1 Tax=Cichlidogyrus casuarinus TaxID=1844966 RepID=A0ABD2QHU3_9PLAT